MAYHNTLGPAYYAKKPGALSGLLDIFNTAVATAVPQYAIVGGVAKPTTSGTLEVFKEFQRQVNRVAKIKGFAPIGIDGDIGPGTIAATQKVQQAAKADLTTDKLANTLGATGVMLIRSSTADGIASAAGQSATHIKGYADQLGVASSVKSPAPAKPPAIYNPATGVSVAQPATSGIIDAFKRMDSTSQMASVGLFGLAGFLLVTKRKKKRK